jgi:peptide deformylase
MREESVFLHDEALAVPSSVKTDWKRRLVNSMIGFAMDRDNIVGLAANQVGHPWRVMIVWDGGKFLECINPEITWMSEEVTYDIERCLSVPGEHRCMRHDRVHLQYDDVHGVRQSKWLTGLPAVIAQHEMDHLNGITIADARP